MNNGQTQTGQNSMNSSTSKNGINADNLFSSAITVGSGTYPEGSNPDARNSLDLENMTAPSRENQGIIGARTLNLEPYMPNEAPEDRARLAGINDMNRANSIMDINPDFVVQTDRDGLGNAVGVEIEEGKDNPKKREESSEPTKNDDANNDDANNENNRLTTLAPEAIESVIAKTGDDVSSLYEIVQNSREGRPGEGQD